MGKDLDIYNSVYKELVEVVGIDAALKIYMRFKGQQITFPVEFYSKQYIYNMIIGEYNGTNIKQLATKYGYSERTIRRILKDETNKKEGF